MCCVVVLFVFNDTLFVCLFTLLFLSPCDAVVDPGQLPQTKGQIENTKGGINLLHGGVEVTKKHRHHSVFISFPSDSHSTECFSLPVTFDVIGVISSG